MSKRGENIYKRKDGRWEGRILIHAPDSKRISVYGKTYREVRDRMQEKKLLPGIVNRPKRVSEATEACSGIFFRFSESCASVTWIGIRCPGLSARFPAGKREAGFS